MTSWRNTGCRDQARVSAGTNDVVRWPRTETDPRPASRRRQVLLCSLFKAAHRPSDLDKCITAGLPQNYLSAEPI